MGYRERESRAAKQDTSPSEMLNVIIKKAIVKKAIVKKVIVKAIVKAIGC